MYLRRDLNILVFSCWIVEPQFVLAGKLLIIGRIDRESSKDEKKHCQAAGRDKATAIQTLKATTRFLGHKALNAVFLTGAPLYIR
jgi:hypothetical protein